MPLIFAEPGREQQIRKVGGKEDVRRHLQSLGLLPGAHVTVVAEMAGNLIVQVKAARVAISREMAQKILV